MATGTLAPSPILQVFDPNGDPLAGAMLFTYMAGTSTPTPVFHDANLTVPWTNPAIADAGGFFISLYMPATSQKWILQNSVGVVQWTVDPVSSIALAGSGGGVGSVLVPLGGDSTSPITNTAYAVGTTVATTHAGTSLYTIDSASIPSGTYAVQGMILSSAGTETVSISLMDLDSGASETPLGTASGVSATGAQVTSTAITFSPAGVAKRYGIKTIVSAGSGFAWGITLTRLS